ncbi:NAD(P)/FAD-dependent oxidoreductase [Mucilaginibacter conchicola]|uniref:NAD(P)/FAD-dependent oxidoreductase n=1 Tax=Mucilaginibacter conchicola TaxID=2303333 RepID=A0A372NWK5_9SPHI|nr:NAD(P)/FAD-dependent oxidoreductase [Mucilaginibacter conchicola]RFZ94493.1 NAD(P)/FAD-dependent oxidoreductase [Mucilaginibacter conchicola]
MADVIIIGGSYAGLSAAMSLGRALRNVVVIDNQDPCNKKVAHSHNFLTQDGAEPDAIALAARKQVLQYPSVNLIVDTVSQVINNGENFEVVTIDGQKFKARKIIFATGIKDILPDIPGFSACWPKSVIHCPYCHGYEERGKKLAVIGNGDEGFEYAKLINNWSKHLTVFTNGTATFNEEQLIKLKKHKINIIESPITALVHEKGHVNHISLANGKGIAVEFIFYRPAFVQKSDIPKQLGCDFTSTGHLQVNMFGETNLPGVFAVGDSCSPMRSVANAVAAGSFTGAYLNKLLGDESF